MTSRQARHPRVDEPAWISWRLWPAKCCIGSFPSTIVNLGDKASETALGFPLGPVNRLRYKALLGSHWVSSGEDSKSPSVLSPLREGPLHNSS